MSISPQLRLSLCLIALLLSTLLIADFLGLLPRPEAQQRETRKLFGESLAVQLSSAAGRGRREVIEDTIREIVNRNDDVKYAGLWIASGERVAEFGETGDLKASFFGRSSTDRLIVPIFEQGRPWGEVQLRFAPSSDWGERYVGIPTLSLQFMLFICASTMLSFYLLMRKALTELNPSKVVPQRVNAAFNVLAEGVVIMDEKRRIVLANQSFANRIGIDPAQLVGKQLDVYEWDLRGDELEQLPWQSALERGEHIQGMPLKLNVDAEQLSFSVNAAPIEDGQGQTKGALVTFDDVTPLEAKNGELASMLAKLSKTQEIIQNKNQELQLLATRDPLTGSLNRRSFMELYQQHYQQAQSAGRALTLLMIDIDHFKRVNDEFGHGVGDQAIKLLADALQRLAPGDDSVGRYGGEEFVATLAGMDLAAGLALAERIRAAIPELAHRQSMPFRTLTVSIGVASYAVDLGSPEELLDRADRALYQAKQTGRDRVCVFDPEYAHVAELPASGSSVNSESAAAALPVSDQADSQFQQKLVEELKGQLDSMEGLVKHQAEELTHRAMHDELTGLPNRFLLLDRLQQAMRHSARNKNLTVVVSISLSAYPEVFSMEGGDAAEAMLKQASERLDAVVRAVDTIGFAFNEQALTLSRIAYNELAMLLIDIENVQSIPQILSRVTTALEQPFLCGSHEHWNKVHCGIAIYPHDGQDADTLIRNATLARSYAERRSQLASGKAYFSKSIDQLATKTAQLATALRSAVENNELDVFYQPKVHAATGAVTGFEALARWHHPEYGQISPLEFIALAEQTGVITHLTDLVLTRVCSDIKVGLLGQSRVSVNVSPIELGDPQTAGRLLDIVRQCEVSPQRIEVEIAESSVLKNLELTRSILSEWQSCGILVALDDFGTAYSSLNLLVAIPFDVIKIDRSFVLDIQQAPENRAVVHAILQMAESMGKRVVAEGVETQEELDCLTALGCQEIQGFFFSQPMPAPQVQAYIDQFGSTVQPSSSVAAEQR